MGKAGGTGLSHSHVWSDPNRRAGGSMAGFVDEPDRQEEHGQGLGGDAPAHELVGVVAAVFSPLGQGKEAKAKAEENARHGDDDEDVDDQFHQEQVNPDTARRYSPGFGCASSAAPKPPPPGVLMTTTSPG